MSRRRLGLGLLILAIALVGGYLYVGTRIYDQLSVAAPKCDGRWAGHSPASFAAGSLDTKPFEMPRYDSVTIPSRDAGLALNAWYIGSDRGPGAPTVLITHGLNSCIREGGLLLAAGMLHRHGYAVLMVDLRNHGDSAIENGRYAGGTNEHRDVLGAWDWLVTVKGLDPSHIGLFGFSLGAATALMAAGEEPRVAATWEDSSYAELSVALRAELARNGYPTFFEYAAYAMARAVSDDDLTSLSPLGAMAKLRGRPLYIVHGTADTRLSVQYAFDLAAGYRAAGGTVEPWIVDGSEHIESIIDHPVDYEQRLATFFESAIGRPPGAG